MSVNLFGWASCSEKGTANGVKGDQTGREVRIGPYYYFGQTHIIRWKSVRKGRSAAKICKKLCQCEKIGYGQDDRTSLYTELSKINWDISRLSEIRKCNTDCSELAVCVINLVMKKPMVHSAYTTHTLNNLAKAFPKYFTLIAISIGTKFHKGDMVNAPGHHVIINV